MKKNDILNYINNNGGITLNKEGKKATLKNGFMVSLYGTEYKTNNKKEVLKKVNEYLEKIKNNNNGLFVGVWLDSGFYYIDFSINILEKNDALEFGKKHKQLSIFDIKNNKYYNIKDFSFNKYYTLYEVVKNDNNDIIDYKLITQYDKINDIINYFNSNIKTVKNSIYNEIKTSYKQLINNKYIIIKDYEVITA